MVLAGFSLQDKLERYRFFGETFLLSDISMEVVLIMLFLLLSDADIGFAESLFGGVTQLQRPYPHLKGLSSLTEREIASATFEPDFK